MLQIGLNFLSSNESTDGLYKVTTPLVLKGLLNHLTATPLKTYQVKKRQPNNEALLFKILQDATQEFPLKRCQHLLRLFIVDATPLSILVILLPRILCVVNNIVFVEQHKSTGLKFI